MAGRESVTVGAFLLLLLLIAVGISVALFNVRNPTEMAGSTNSSGTAVLIDPPMIIDETLQAGSTFIVKVNVSDVNDLFAWQVNMSWDPLILNVNNVTFGNFLAGQPEGTSTSLGYPAVFQDNIMGNVMFAETTVGDYSGVAGNGWLASVEFLVVGYGSTVLEINSTRTSLLNNPLFNIEFTAENGYFSNKIIGDVDGDQDVDASDLVDLSEAYGSKPGDSNWNPDCDFNLDGHVNLSDFFGLSKNFGRSIS